MKVILMKWPNNVEMEPPTGSFFSLNEASRARNGLHITELLYKKPHKNPQTMQSIVCSPQSDRKTLAEGNTYNSIHNAIH